MTTLEGKIILDPKHFYQLKRCQAFVRDLVEGVPYASVKEVRVDAERVINGD